MRGIDAAPIEAALNARSHNAAFESERHKRLESWRARLLSEGPAALDELVEWCPAADRKSLQALIQKATTARVDSGSRDAASRELFRTLRSLFEASS
jgi:ribosome-associated protein